MIKTVKKILGRDIQKMILEYNQEIEWAQVYHDAIRGITWLDKLPLNVGRWAGNYPFFYVLHRILNDFKPTSILELGLGESSKFISTYLSHYLVNSSHTIVEHDEGWISAFNNRFKLCDRSLIQQYPLITNRVKGFETLGYDGISALSHKFDLYIIDGPFGSKKYSRFDILHLLKQVNETDEFIIILDDTNRQGERQTLEEVINFLKGKGLNLHIGRYRGRKELTVLATGKYKYAKSM